MGGVNVTIPSNAIFSRLPYVVVSAIVFDLKRFGQMNSTSLLSDEVDIDLYYSNDPFAMNGAYNMIKISVKDLENPIGIDLPYNTKGQAISSICSYME
jgi:DNA/RNA endonuclease G (NUC1)